MQTPASGPLDPPNARRFDITGCHLAAIILERLQFWTPKAKRRVKGVV